MFVYLSGDEVVEGVGVSQIPGQNESLAAPTLGGAADTKQSVTRDRTHLEAKEEKKERLKLLQQSQFYPYFTDNLFSHPDVCELHPRPVCVQHHPRVGGELAPSPRRLGVEVQVAVLLPDLLHPDGAEHRFNNEQIKPAGENNSRPSRPHPLPTVHRFTAPLSLATRTSPKM